MSNIGEYLKRLRTEKHMSIEDVATGTGIRAQYLEALEKSDYAKIPGDVFIKGFIRNYGNFLEVDGNALVEEYKTTIAADVKNTVATLDSAVVEEILDKAAPSEDQIQAAVDAVVTRNKQRTKHKNTLGESLKNAWEDIKNFIYDNLYETVEEEIEPDEGLPQTEVSDATQKLEVTSSIIPDTKEALEQSASVAPPQEPEVIEHKPVDIVKKKEAASVKTSSSFFNFKIFAAVFLLLFIAFAGVIGYFMFGNIRPTSMGSVSGKLVSGIKSPNSTEKPAKNVDNKLETSKSTAKEEKKTDSSKAAADKDVKKVTTDTASKGSGNGVVVEITYKEPVWTQVTADGNGLEAAIIPKGATRIYKGNNEVKVNLGAIRNVVIKVNGKEVPYGEKEWGEGTKIFKK